MVAAREPRAQAGFGAGADFGFGTGLRAGVGTTTGSPPSVRCLRGGRPWMFCFGGRSAKIDSKPVAVKIRFVYHFVLGR